MCTLQSYLFMNNVHNVLFILIIGTVFESSLFFWDFFPATSLPKIFLPWFSLRSMSQVFSSWLFGLFHPDGLWILSYLHHHYSDLCFWRQSRESLFIHRAVGGLASLLHVLWPYLGYGLLYFIHVIYKSMLNYTFFFPEWNFVVLNFKNSSSLCLNRKEKEIIKAEILP